MKLSSRLSVSLLLLVCTLGSAAVLLGPNLAPDESDSSRAPVPGGSKVTTTDKSTHAERIVQKRKSIWGIYQEPEASPSSSPESTQKKPQTSNEPRAEVFDIREWTRERPSRLEKEFNKASGIEEEELEDDSLWSHRSKRQPVQRGQSNSVVDRILDRAFPEPGDDTQSSDQQDGFEVLTLKRRLPDSRDSLLSEPLTDKELEEALTKSLDEGIAWEKFGARRGPESLLEASKLWLQDFQQQNDLGPQQLLKHGWGLITNNLDNLGSGSRSNFQVKSSYIDVHSGPGSHFPSYQIIEQGEIITLINSTYNWYQVETPYGHRGWISAQVLLEELIDPEQPRLSKSKPPWSIGISGGLFEQDTYLQYQLNYPLSEQLSLQAVAGAISGDDKNAYLIQAGIKHSLFKFKAFNSFVTTHIGYFDSQDTPLNVNPNEIDGTLFSMGLGIEIPVNQYFSITSELKQHIAFIGPEDVNPFSSITGGLLFKNNTDLHQQVNRYLDNRIDQDNRQIGLYSGLYSADYIDTALVYGVYFSQNINDRLQLTLNWAQTDLSTAALNDPASLETPANSSLSYLIAQTEYNLFQAELQTGKYQQMASFYVSGGFGVTKFEQQNNVTMVLGSGVNIDINDWLSLNTALRTHILEDDRLGSPQTSYNIEITSGFNFVF